MGLQNPHEHLQIGHRCLDLMGDVRHQLLNDLLILPALSAALTHQVIILHKFALDPGRQRVFIGKIILGLSFRDQIIQRPAQLVREFAQLPPLPKAPQNPGQAQSPAKPQQRDADIRLRHPDPHHIQETSKHDRSRRQHTPSHYTVRSLSHYFISNSIVNDLTNTTCLEIPRYIPSRAPS